MATTVIEYIQSKGLEYRIQSGQIVLKICPFCGDQKNHFYMAPDEGTFFCHKCQERGNIITLKKHYGDLNQDRHNINKPSTKPQGAVSGAFPNKNGYSAVPDEKKATEAHEQLLSDKDGLEYITGTRGIRLETVKKFKIGLQIDRNGDRWLTIPHYEKDKLINIKSRSLPPAEKTFRRVKDCRSILFNGDVIEANKEAIFITEGEIDALTLIDQGVENVVGVTVGAGTFNPSWLDQLQAVKKIILVYDPDEPGQKGVREAARRLGYDRCFNVVLPDGQDVNEYLQTGHGLSEFQTLVDEARQFDSASIPTEESLNEEKPESIDPQWECAKAAFPYQTDFPWGIFPHTIADSLLACAESCATSPTALAGTAKAILASTLGRMVLVSPKQGWEDPLLVWVADIRASGDGKTPCMNLLSRPLHQAQYKSDAEFKAAREAWENAEGAEKLTRGPEPKWSRSYFASGLTLEGCRTAIEEGHGGLVCTFSELSAFITGQGQYKGGRGDDREAWLVMFDGKPARILRAGKSLTIPESSVSVCGGIQPEVLVAVFGDKKAVLLDDGTAYRFLFTYERSCNYELTKATWSDDHRAAWEGLIKRALKWADTRFESGQPPLILRLSDESWDCFSGFRNSTFAARDSFPPAFRGFIPKGTSYVLRLAGLLHVFEQLSNGEDISPVIDFETIQKAIAAVRFYLGHTVEALKLLRGKQTVIQQSDAEKHLISVLEGLSRKAEGQGFVTVKDIADGYNSMTGKNETARRIGSLLRGIDLEPKQVFHGRYGIYWGNLQKYLKTTSPKSPSHPARENQGFREDDFNKQRHLSHPNNGTLQGDGVTWVTSENQSHPMQHAVNNDLGDLGDVKSKQSEKKQSTTTGLFKIGVPVEVV